MKLTRIVKIRVDLILLSVNFRDVNQVQRLFPRS